MKIIQITPSYKPAYIYGGPTMSVAKLCEALVQYEEADLEVLTTTANGQNELNVEPNKQVNVDGVRVTYFKRITKDHTHFSPDLLLALRRKIKEQNSQLIIHIHSWWNLVTIFSCLIAKLFQVPVVLSPRGMLTNYTQNNRHSFFKAALHTIIGKSLLKYVHIIASSEQEKQDVLAIVHPRSITILANLVSLPKEQRAKSKMQGAVFNLLFLSRIEEKKGLDILFDALVNLTFEWSLSIGGSGEENYIESLKLKAKSLKIDGNINWLGQVNNDNKFDLMATHDLLVLTSHNENFANVIIESLSVGTPVLISEQVGLAGYIKDKKLGYVTELKVDCITEKLGRAMVEKEELQRINLDGPRIINEDFNEEILIHKYLNLYKQII